MLIRRAPAVEGVPPTARPPISLPKATYQSNSQAVHSDLGAEAAHLAAWRRLCGPDGSRRHGSRAAAPMAFARCWRREMSWSASLELLREGHRSDRLHNFPKLGSGQRLEPPV